MAALGTSELLPAEGRQQPAAAVEPDRPIRVMHILFALQAGGMEYGVVKIANGLDPRRVSTTICSTRPAGGLKELLAPHVRLIECHRREGNDPRIVLELWRVLRRERPDIVHTHGWGTLCEGLLAARMARVPFVIHGEHGTLQLKPNQVRTQRWAWQRTNQLLSVSSRLAERIAETTGYPLARIQVIRNGVDLDRFNGWTQEDARAALGLPAEGVIVGTVGRLVPVKAQATLLEAMALLKGRGIRATTIIAGDGPLREALVEQAATLGLTDSLRMLGHRRDVEVVLKALDVFVLPSISEGLSNTILEAMAAGRPVVATRVGGADELVLDGITGTLVAAGSPRALADGLAPFLENQRYRQARGRAARQRVEAEFSLTGMIERYERLYLQLVTGASRPVAGLSMRRRSRPELTEPAL